MERASDAGIWRKQRRRILERLHGVDLDGEAVLAARRALWLEAADEPAGPLSDEETAVLAHAIRQGDALTGAALDPWVGTFDVVLGNPPYRRERGAKSLFKQIAQTEFGRRWRTARMDLWYYFAHRSLDLLRDGGLVSLVVSGYWTAGRGAAKLVEQLRRETHVEEIVDLDRLNVFDGVAGRHMIFRARKTRGDGGTTRIVRPAHGAAGSVESFLREWLPMNGGPRSVVAGMVVHVADAMERVPPCRRENDFQHEHGVTAPLRSRLGFSYEKTRDELFRDGRVDLEPVDRGLLESLGRGTPLGRLGRVRQGIAENPAVVTRATEPLLDNARAGQGVFVLTAEEVAALDLPERERLLLRPYHALRDVGRYSLAESASRALIYSTPQTCPDVREYPTIERHLARFRPIMEARRETRLGRRPWWQLHWPREASLWTADKILSVQMAARPAFAAARRPVWVNFSVNVFVPDAGTREDLLYLTALLNSRVLWQWFRHHAKRRGVGLEINGRALAQAPIRRIDFLDTAERWIHNELVELAGALGRVRVCTHQDGPLEKPVGQAVPDIVGKVNDSSVRHSLTYGACKHTPYESDAIERRIDELVCQLYGLGDVPDEVAPPYGCQAQPDLRCKALGEERQAEQRGGQDCGAAIDVAF